MEPFRQIKRFLLWRRAPPARSDDGWRALQFGIFHPPARTKRKTRWSPPGCKQSPARGSCHPSDSVRKKSKPSDSRKIISIFGAAAPLSGTLQAERRFDQFSLQLSEKRVIFGRLDVSASICRLCWRFRGRHYSKTNACLICSFRPQPFSPPPPPTYNKYVTFSRTVQPLNHVAQTKCKKYQMSKWIEISHLLPLASSASAVRVF